ncbi:MAG: discoidin domain-containing protein [Fimbriimonas sp.]
MIHLFAAAALAATGAAQGDTTTNFARGRPVEVTPRPNYLKDAATQSESVLTDGQVAPGIMWLNPATLGWIRPSSVTITVDLGKRQRVGRIVFSTGAGSGNVRLPGSILALVSDDGRNWRGLGDLMRLTDADANPPTKYTPIRIDAKGLSGQGRYVRLVATPEGAFVFCDEVEVYGGPRPTTPPAPERATGDVETLRVRAALAGSVTRRREKARRALANAVEVSGGANRAALRGRIPSAAAVRAGTEGAEGLAFPAAADLKIGQAAAALWRSKGVKGVRTWHRHRFDPIGVHEVPSGGAASVSIEAMRGEKRSDAILISSTLPQSVDVAIALQGLSTTGLSLAASPWMDTREGELVSVALPWQAARKTGMRIRVHPGVTTRLWLRLDGGVRGPGGQKGQIVLAWPGGKSVVSTHLRVSSVRVPNPRISLGLFDYAEGKGAFDMRPSQIPAAIREMKAHAVNSPWASRDILPWPEASAFDRAGRLRPLSTTRLVNWARKWPEAPTLVVFANVRPTFAGATPGTPTFRARVAAWARELAGDLKSAGIRPGRLTLLLIDESTREDQARLIQAYAEAIRAGTRDIKTLANPLWTNDANPAFVAARRSVDIVCELAERVLERPERARVQSGQTLWFYQTQPGARTLDASQYYRLLPWLALRYGGKGVVFWSLADSGGAHTPLSELRAPQVYSPAIRNGDKLVDTVQWQAMMEGVEDHELMTSLRQMAKTASQRSEAAALVDEAVRQVLRDYRPGDVRWSVRRDRSAPDVYRRRAMALMERWAGAK